MKRHFRAHQFQTFMGKHTPNPPRRLVHSAFQSMSSSLPHETSPLLPILTRALVTVYIVLIITPQLTALVASDKSARGVLGWI